MLANSWGGDIVGQAGGQLLTNGLRSASGFARISDEIVVERNPDIIIAVPHGSPGDIERLAEYYEVEPELGATTKAVKNEPRLRRDGQLAAAAVSRRGGDDPQTSAPSS